MRRAALAQAAERAADGFGGAVFEPAACSAADLEGQAPSNGLQALCGSSCEQARSCESAWWSWSTQYCCHAGPCVQTAGSDQEAGCVVVRHRHAARHCDLPAQGHTHDTRHYFKQACGGSPSVNM